VDNCVNCKANGNICAPQDQVDAIRRSLSFWSYFMDSFINLNEYENPANMTLNRVVYDMPNTAQKRAYHMVRNTYIHTDFGILFEDQKVYQLFRLRV
jgi:hypothetical protein